MKKKNEQIYKNTVKENKDLQILHKIGFNEHIKISSFLTIK